MVSPTRKSGPILYLIVILIFLSVPLTYSQTNTSEKKPRNGRLFDEEGTTDSDILLSIENANEIVETAYSDAQFKGGIYRMFEEMDRTKSKLDLILTNLKDSSPNVRNQQMYRTVLEEIQNELDDQNEVINKKNEQLGKIRRRIAEIRKDTVFTSLRRDTVRRKHFKAELSGLRAKYRSTDSLMDSHSSLLSSKKRLIVERNMAVSKAMLRVQDMLEKSGVSMFGNEYPYLWNTETEIKNKNLSRNIKGKFEAERDVFAYYFSYTTGRLIGLLVIVGLLGWWISRNIKYLKTKAHFDRLQLFDFKYLNKGIVVPLLVINLNLAIVTNLHAPALFVEFLQLLLLAALTYLFKGNWTKKSLQNWLLLIILFTVLCFLDLFVKISFIERCLFILINLAGIRYGLIQLSTIKDQLYIKGFFKWSSFIFIGFNFLAIIFNLFGRVSLAHTLSLTAVIALSQIIALSVLLKIILEIILLQIYTTRIKHGIEKIFDHESLSQNLKRPFILIISYMWLVVIASNLNIWESLSNTFDAILHHPNKIGTISFTLGSLLLFIIIVWIAHLLQKYVAYFFGEIDEESEENVNKRQHSKLMVTRLIVLVCGYLLAIAASGMPLDQLSIVIGALGVGIGLGLQNIVNNFVSGVILIFDRPIQVGDVIELSSETGRVKTIGLRTTKIDASNGAEIIIPNGNILSQNITNWTYTDHFKLAEISFGIKGELNHEKVDKIILKALHELPHLNDEKVPMVYYNSITDSEYRLLVKFWCSIYRTEEAISSARQALYDAFKEHGISFIA